MYKYYDLENLPVLDHNRRSLQASSFDREYENADWAQYLYEENDTYIMFDEVGTGCVKSIWMAVTSQNTKMEFYFDGEDTPRWTTTTMDLFNGDIPELTGVGNSFELRGHYELDDCRCGNCMIQIPFKKGLKIVCSGEKKIYYHFLYEMYSEGEKQIGNCAPQKMIDAFENKRKAYEDAETVTNSYTLKKGWNDVYDRQTAGVIREFTVRAKKNIDLRKLDLTVFVDEGRGAEISCPLSHFFAQPHGYSPVDTMAVHARDDGDDMILSFYLPIPFWDHCVVSIVNQQPDPIDITVTAVTTENSYDKKNTGHLYGIYYEGRTQMYEDWLLGEFYGRGSVVGLVQTCFGGAYCEGNEHFYINGARTPRINGTGTEDLYLACYWPNYKFDSPIAGCVNDVYLMGGSTLEGAQLNPIGYYRYFLDMPINFECGIKLAIQHGAVSQTYSDYSSLCLVYRIPENAAEQTDYISLDSDASKMLHSYKCDGIFYTHNSKLESDVLAPTLKKNGYKTPAGGKVSFKIAVLSNNKGAFIRRLYDQTVNNRGTEVYVDGEFAGIWNCPNYNEYFGFADDDFYIPERLTQGKNILNIEIVSKNCYTDFDYTVFTKTK